MGRRLSASGVAGGCPPKRNGKKPPAAAKVSRHSRGVRASIAISPIIQSVIWMHPTAPAASRKMSARMASLIWPGMLPSSRMTGMPPDYYLNSPYKNPMGPESSPMDTVASRGGSFFSQMKFLKVYHRVNEFHRYNAFQNVGFRCVIPPVGIKRKSCSFG